MSNDIQGSSPSLFKKLELTYKLANYPASAKLDNARIDSIISEAFDKWRLASPFSFKPSTSGTPDIVLSFGNVRNSAAYGETNWQEHTIVFDNSRTWIATPVIWSTSQPDLLSVAVHEIGHVLGLPDNDIDASVMERTLDAFEGAKYRGPIPQVDIDKLGSLYVSIFSKYYALMGQVKWHKRGKSFFIDPYVPIPEHLIPKPPKDATELKLYQVSAGIDGTVWVVDGYSFAYDNSVNEGNKDWTFRGGWLSRVAVFDSKLVLGIFIDEQWGGPYGDLRRFDYATLKWISVDNGSLPSSAKFKNIAIGGVKGKEEVWAVATPQTNGGRPVDEEDILVVRYNGNIIEGNGKWQVMASRDPRFVLRPMHELGVGHRPSEEPWICGTLPTVNFRGDIPLPPRQFYALAQDGPPAWRELYQGIIPPDRREVDPLVEVKRWNNARRTFSVGNDGTIVAIMGDRAFRRSPEFGLWPPPAGELWDELPSPGAQWIDISVVDKKDLWGVDANRDIFSTIVTQ